MSGELDLKSASEDLIRLMMSVLGGKLTCAEVLGQGEIAISRYAMTV